jgi:hypothetical protein
MYSTNNKQHTTKKKLTPWSPPAPGFQRLQNNRWVRSPDVARWRTISATRWCNFVNWKSLIQYYYTTCPRAADQRACWQKTFLSFVASNQRALTPAVCGYCFCRCVPCVISIILEHYLSTRSWSACLLTKGVFFKWIYMFFYHSLRQINAQYPQLYVDIILQMRPMSSSCFDMIFRTRGEGTMVTMFAWGAW